MANVSRETLYFLVDDISSEHLGLTNILRLCLRLGEPVGGLLGHRLLHPDRGGLLNLEGLGDRDRLGHSQPNLGHRHQSLRLRAALSGCG